MEAGLPDAVGKFGTGAGYSNTVASGAFKGTSRLSGSSVGATGNAYMGDTPSYEMKLSYSNAIFGNSDTVQPSALTARFYIKF